MLRYLYILLMTVTLHTQECRAQTISGPDQPAPIEDISPDRAVIRFRLLDQHDQPIGKRSFYYSNTGGNQQLESLGGGYYVLSFDWRPGRKSLPTILLVADADIQPADYPLRPQPGKVVDAGVIRVHRFAEESQHKARIRVVDPEGKAVSGVTIVANPKAVWISPDAQQRIKSDESGIVEIDVYPTKYYVHAVHHDYLVRKAETFDFAALTSDDVSTLVVYPLPNYSIELAWIEFDGATDKPVAQEVVHLALQNGELVNANEQPGWINALQVNERVGLQFPNASESGFAGKDLITARMVNPPSDRESAYKSLTLDQSIEVCPFIEMPNWTVAPRDARKQGNALTAVAEDIVIGVLEPHKSRADANYIRFKIRVQGATPQKKLVTPPSVAELREGVDSSVVVADAPNWTTSLIRFAALLGALGLIILLWFYRQKIAADV